MDNTVLYCMLVRQPKNIYHLCADSKDKLDHTQTKTDLTSIRDELVRLVVSKLHNHHAFLNLRVEVEVKGDSAWKFDIEHPNTASIRSAIFTTLIVKHCIGHAE